MTTDVDELPLVVFIEANKHQKAMVVYEKALEWQELFTLAVSNCMSDAKLVETAYRVAGELFFNLLT